MTTTNRTLKLTFRDFSFKLHYRLFNVIFFISFSIFYFHFMAPKYFLSQSRCKTEKAYKKKNKSSSKNIKMKY